MSFLLFSNLIPVRDLVLLALSLPLSGSLRLTCEEIFQVNGLLVKFRKACEVSKLTDIFHVITSAKQLSLSGSGAEVSHSPSSHSAGGWGVGS